MSRETQFRALISSRNLQTRFEMFSINPQEPGCRGQGNRWREICRTDKPRGTMEDEKAQASSQEKWEQKHHGEVWSGVQVG